MTVSDQEQAFQEAYAAWSADNNNKKAWDEMFFRVHECCRALAGKMMKGVYSDKFEERVMDATLYFMERLKKDPTLHPRKLSSWCYLGVKGHLYGPKQQREDKEYSYDQLIEDMVEQDREIVYYYPER